MCMSFFFALTGRKKEFRGRGSKVVNIISRMYLVVKKKADLTFFYEVEKIIFEGRINLS